MMKLKCSFPWMGFGIGNYTKCGKKHKIIDLVNLINNVNQGTPEIMTELEDFGCNQQNCHQTNWDISSFQRIDLDNRDGQSFLRLIFPSSKKISVMEESLAYTTLDLLADIGGYAGIFVGASIITLYDATLSLISNIWRIIMNCIIISK